MTLVLAYTCDEFAIQVSDRRLSRGGVSVPTEFNKAVLWCGLVLVGYTGFAFINPRQRQPDDQVDEWIMETLYYRRSVAEVMSALSDGATTWVSKMPGVQRRQAFSLNGWAPQADGRFEPFAGLVSNFHDTQGRSLSMANSSFTTLLALPSPRPWFVTQVGQELTKSESRWMRRGLDRLLAQGAGPDRVADLLANIVRQVADRVPSVVGRSVMVSCLPRPSGDAAGFFLTERRGRPTLDTPTFFYRGEDRDATVAFGPLYVCGEQGYSDMELEYLNESGSDVSIRVRVRGPKT